MNLYVSEQVIEEQNIVRYKWYSCRIGTFQNRKECLIEYCHQNNKKEPNIDPFHDSIA